MEELLGCVRNIRQVAMLLQQAGRRFKGPHGHQAAAVCIQAHWRSAQSCVYGSDYNNSLLSKKGYVIHWEQLHGLVVAGGTSHGRG